MSNIVYRFFRKIFYYNRMIYVKVFGSIFYDSKYLKSKWFSKPSSLGWEWASMDIRNRLFHHIHWHYKWPLSPDIDCGMNIYFDPEDINNFFGKGNYFQTFDASIHIGKGTKIAKNVGIITSNHNPLQLEEHLPGEDVHIGQNCWIGMNSIILPGVVLGNRTIVGAGAVVTKSFPDGNCIIAGNPAKIIRQLATDE